MPPLTVICDDCRKRWKAQTQDGELVPVHDACPNCGGTAFSAPSEDG